MVKTHFIYTRDALFTRTEYEKRKQLTRKEPEVAHDHELTADEYHRLDAELVSSKKVRAKITNTFRSTAYRKLTLM